MEWVDTASRWYSLTCSNINNMYGTGYGRASPSPESVDGWMDGWNQEMEKQRLRMSAK